MAATWGVEAGSEGYDEDAIHRTLTGLSSLPMVPNGLLVSVQAPSRLEGKSSDPARAVRSGIFWADSKRAISVTYPHIRADIRAAGDVVRWDITWRVCNSLAGGLPKYSGSDKEPRPATESKPHLKRPIGSLPE